MMLSFQMTTLPAAVQILLLLNLCPGLVVLRPPSRPTKG